MNKEVLTETKFVAECAFCDFREQYNTRFQAQSALGGHAHKGCESETRIIEIVLPVCRSCGYHDGQEGTTVTVVDDDNRYTEDALCDVCKKYRDRLRQKQAVIYVFELDNSEPVEVRL